MNSTPEPDEFHGCHNGEGIPRCFRELQSTTSGLLPGIVYWGFLMLVCTGPTTEIESQCILA